MSTEQETVQIVQPNTESKEVHEKKKVSFEVVFPDINPILTWLNVEMNKIGLESYKLENNFFEKDSRNRARCMILTNNLQEHQYEDSIFFLEFDLKEKTEENIEIRNSLVIKKTLEQRAHNLYNLMIISEMSCDICLLNMEKFEKVRRLYTNLLDTLNKKYEKIQKSFDVSCSYEKMLEWKQNLEPITNYFSYLKNEIEKISQMLATTYIHYEQFKLNRVVNKHTYEQAMNYLETCYS